MQYEMLQKVLGFKIHPLIALPQDESEPWIADVGTGTGIFLLDVVKDLPKTSRIFGFDITDAHFPTRDVPENVQFVQHDMRTPFPEEYLGRFDVINIRLVLLGLRDDEWSLAAEQLATLLSRKPKHELQERR